MLGSLPALTAEDALLRFGHVHAIIERSLELLRLAFADTASQTRLLSFAYNHVQPHVITYYRR
jgi:hypothetical protein